MDGRLYSGDEIVAVDGQSVMGASHHVVVGMMGSAAQRAQVQLTVRRRAYQGEVLLQPFEFLRYSPLFWIRIYQEARNYLIKDDFDHL
jgi:hypothetical protein